MLLKNQKEVVSQMNTCKSRLTNIPPPPRDEYMGKDSCRREMFPAGHLVTVKVQLCKNHQEAMPTLRFRSNTDMNDVVLKHSVGGLTLLDQTLLNTL